MRILPTLIVLILLVTGAAFMLSEKLAESASPTVVIDDLTGSTTPAALITPQM